MAGLIAWALGPVGRYVVLALLVLAGATWLKYDVARDAVTAFIAKQQAKEIDRVQTSADADDASRKCARDPDCRLRDDGHRRD